jgi:hypothetical protein
MRGGAPFSGNDGIPLSPRPSMPPRTPLFFVLSPPRRAAIPVRKNTLQQKNGTVTMVNIRVPW